MKKRTLKDIQITVKMDRELLSDLRKEAKAEERTLAGYIRKIIIYRHGIPMGRTENIPAPGPGAWLEKMGIKPPKKRKR
jgi:hypothetical protein